jgi:hypothetical protein
MFRVREKAFIARAAAFVLKGEKVAIVIGSTIYLHGTKKTDLLTSTAWLRHELLHVQQYQQHGTFLFAIKYLWESFRKGYRNNRYEIEARKAETVFDFEKKFEVVSRKEEQITNN